MFLSSLRRTATAAPRLLLAFCSSLFSVFDGGSQPQPALEPPFNSRTFSDRPRSTTWRLQEASNTYCTGVFNKNDPWVAKLVKDFHCDCCYCTAAGNPAVRRSDQWDNLKQLLNYTPAIESTPPCDKVFTSSSTATEQKPLIVDTGAGSNEGLMEVDLATPVASQMKLVASRDDENANLASTTSVTSPHDFHTEFRMPQRVNSRIINVRGDSDSTTSLPERLIRASLDTAKSLGQLINSAFSGASNDDIYPHQKVTHTCNRPNTLNPAAYNKDDQARFEFSKTRLVFTADSIEDLQRAGYLGSQRASTTQQGRVKSTHSLHQATTGKKSSMNLLDLDAPDKRRLYQSNSEGLIIREVFDEEYHNAAVQNDKEPLVELLEDECLARIDPRMSANLSMGSIPLPFTPAFHSLTEAPATTSILSPHLPPKTPTMISNVKDDLVVKLLFRQPGTKIGAAGHGTPNVNELFSEICNSIFIQNEEGSLTSMCGSPSVTVKKIGDNGIEVGLRLALGPRAKMTLSEVILENTSLKINKHCTVPEFTALTTGDERTKQKESSSFEPIEAHLAQPQGILKPFKEPLAIPSSPLVPESTITDKFTRDDSPRNTTKRVAFGGSSTKPSFMARLMEKRAERQSLIAAAIAEGKQPTEVPAEGDFNTCRSTATEVPSVSALTDSQRRAKRIELLNKYFGKGKRPTTLAATSTITPPTSTTGTSARRNESNYLLRRSHKPTRNLPRSPAKTSVSILGAGNLSFNPLINH